MPKGQNNQPSTKGTKPAGHKAEQTLLALVRLLARSTARDLINDANGGGENAE